MLWIISIKHFCPIISYSYIIILWRSLLGPKLMLSIMKEDNVFLLCQKNDYEQELANDLLAKDDPFFVSFMSPKQNTFLLWIREIRAFLSYLNLKKFFKKLKKIIQGSFKTSIKQLLRMLIIISCNMLLIMIFLNHYNQALKFLSFTIFTP